MNKQIAPLTIDEFNDKIDQSEEDFKEGRFTETKELLKSIDSWK
jgi:predicted transcriptional regulator